MRTGAGKLLPFVATAILVLGVATRAAPQTVPCEAPVKVREALRTLPQSTGNAEADRAARIAALKALLRRFPDDAFVHARYQSIAMYPTVKERDAVIAEYRTLVDKRPKSPLYAFLAARSVIGSDTKRAIPELEKVAPVVPPARLELIRIYQASAFKDAAKARDQMQAFTTACPGAVNVFRYMRSLEPSDFLKTNTDRLRTILQSRTDPDSLGYYTTLWALEFRVKAMTEHDTLRKQIAEDLKRLRALDTGKDVTLYSVLQEGYKLANDTEGAKWATDQMRKSPRAGFSEEMSAWNEAHPYPKPNDPPEKTKAYNEARVKATAEWTHRWPNEVYTWFSRVNALTAVDNAPAAEIEEAGEGLLKTVAKSPGSLRFVSSTGGSSFALLVANLYAQRNVRLDRLPELVKQGVVENESPSQSGTWQSDLYLPPPGGDSDDYAKYYGRRTIVDIWLKAKDRERARQALLDFQTMVDSSKPKLDPKDPQQASQRRTYLSRQVDYWQRMGDLAQLEGHKTDAMTFYENAILARTTTPTSGQKDELAEKARALWTDIGGSNEGWQAWFTRKDLLGLAGPEASGSAAFTKIEKTLPDFDLADMSGARVRLADFKGKVTLVGIWATW